MVIYLCETREQLGLQYFACVYRLELPSVMFMEEWYVSMTSDTMLNWNLIFCFSCSCFYLFFLCFMVISFFLVFLFVYYQVGTHLGWRYAFWGEAILMLPLVVFGFVVKPLQLKGWLSSAHFHSFIITLLGSNRFICEAYLPFIIIGFASSRPKLGETAEQIPVEGA